VVRCIVLNAAITMIGKFTVLKTVPMEPKMTNNDLLWLVGFYEGEGSCGCYRKTCTSKTGKLYIYPNGYLSVTISQKDKQSVHWIQKQLGYGSIRMRPQQSSSLGGSIWIWNANHRDAVKFLTMIKPYLKLNRRKVQLIKALTAYEAK
jgi:hypothetical protein